MTPQDLKAHAFAIPLTNPAVPESPYRFVHREYLNRTYRTDPCALRTVAPEPLEVGEPLVNDEFTRISDSTGFGDDTESG